MLLPFRFIDFCFLLKALKGFGCQVSGVRMEKAGAGLTPDTRNLKPMLGERFITSDIGLGLLDRHLYPPLGTFESFFGDNRRQG
jgi:hypothetical protein